MTEATNTVSGLIRADGDAPPARDDRPGGWRETALAVLPLALLLPFAASAFRIDDPLFIWVAQQIQAHPLDPYGFTVNWYGWPSPMSEVLQNPPLAAYFLALAAALLGWSETALHLAFLLPALAAALGIYRLATRLCAAPLLAAWIALLSPVFLLSSMTVMSDIAMLALWLWAVNLWIIGLDERRETALLASAALTGLAALTKYFAIALVPLLLVYALARRRRLERWALYLLLPVLLLAGYQWWTGRLYGSGMFLNAAAYASTYGREYGRFSAFGTAIAFAFLGGCTASTLLFAPRLWPRRWLLAGLLAAGVLTAAVYSSGALAGFAHIRMTPASLLSLSAQMAVWMVAGVSLLALAADDLRARPGADSLLLALWLAGTLLFAGYLNWSMNGRSLLPLAAPAAVLIVRRLERAAADPATLASAGMIPLALCALLGVLLLQAEGNFADASRQAAARITDKYKPADRRVWFLGHWGFQYYMEQQRAQAMDTRTGARFAVDDVLAIPSVNSNVGSGEPPSWGTYLEFLDLPAARWVSATGYGGGFHSDEYGPVPFAFSQVPPERFAIVGVKPELRGR